ncbi:MAG: hypothetical protein KDD44_08790, partial [Bdellovibrionales bacterium]|nr:hypothetical protein [Bdellovibrionales bacterium]
MELAAILRESCLQNIAINFLVDGTFSFNNRFLNALLSSLADGGRNLFVTLYLGNGPAQRRFSTTSIPGFASTISPSEFRERILSDIALQAEYQAIARSILPVVEHIISLGGQVTLVPFLEDNLDNRSYETMVDLTLAAIPQGTPVSIGRNPCGRDCFAGNE